MSTARWLRSVVCASILTTLAACGGGGSAADSTAASPPAPSGSTPAAGAPSAGAPAGAGTAQSPARLALMISDASSSDWATVGVELESVALVPQGGGSPVTVYSAPTPAPMLNLEQLDHIAQLLGTASVPSGTYSGALLTLSGNPGDVALVSSSAPRADADATPATAIASSQIAIQGVQGASGAQTVSVQVPFATPLSVQAGDGARALNLELPLSRPSLILAHAPVDKTPTLWAVTFAGAVTPHTVSDISALVLREMYATLGAVSADGLSLSAGGLNPAEPIVSPETARPSGQALTLLADTGNGTIIDDLDAGTEMTVSNFAAAGDLTAGKYLRIQARFQSSGALVATRLWVSSQFAGVWQSPEGHVVAVDTANGTLTIEDEAGHSQKVGVTDGTEFDFQGHAIGTGRAFLASGVIEPGFKVHVGAVSAGKGQSTAQSVDIESAIFSGVISQVGGTGFTYASQYQPPTGNYTLSLNYIAASSPNGTAPNGDAIQGYDYSNFAFPSELAYGATAVPDFELATTGPVSSQGVSLANWGDPDNPDGWAVASTVLVPVPLGLATVQTALVTNGNISSLSVLPAGSTTPLTVQLINASGSAALVYQMNRGKGGVSVTAVDISTSNGLSQLSSALQAGTQVRLFGLPKADGTLQVYTLVYYTGVKPSH